MVRLWSLSTCPFLLFACTAHHHEVDLQTVPAAPRHQEVVRLQPEVTSNPNNPLDSIGRWHNSILVSLLGHESETGDTTRAGQNRFLEAYAQKHWGRAAQLSRVPEMESAIRKDYERVLFSLPGSPEAMALLKRLAAILRNLPSTEDYASYKSRVEAVEREIPLLQLATKEKDLLWLTASMLRHSGYYWMQEFNNMPGSNGRTNGFLRKLLGAICSTGADVTTAAYHYVRNTRADGIILEASRMSFICGYYTGWYDNAW